jgi:hypothetical protein
LYAGFSAHGKSWVNVAKMIPGRTQRQCRTRWVQLNKDDKEKEKEENGEAVVTPLEIMVPDDSSPDDENNPELFDDSDAYDEEDFE